MVRTPKWLADPVFRFIRLDDKRLQRAIQRFNDDMCSYSTLDFIEMYKNTQPLFDAPHGDLATFYMDLPALFDAMMEHLNFQFHGIHEELSAVNNLYSLVKKAVPPEIAWKLCPLRVQAKTLFLILFFHFTFPRYHSQL
ncbi:hypothetical protein HPB51_027257 [Rhipicephalus microplus]|uniref:Uncharacterized protein n=1 Tax=Rhipicephalus microplus TaxID=6941 RepID=A0A9J6D0D4_RHIMP|nr:hypothetical protein HPB51_027257 [Rhipicephalus microplus]